MLFSAILRDGAQSTHVAPWDTRLSLNLSPAERDLPPKSPRRGTCPSVLPVGRQWLGSPLPHRLTFERICFGICLTPQCRHPCRQSSTGVRFAPLRVPERCSSASSHTCVMPRSGDRCAKVERAQRTSRLPRLLLSHCAPSAHSITRVPPRQQRERV